MKIIDKIRHFGQARKPYVPICRICNPVIMLSLVQNKKPSSNAPIRRICNPAIMLALVQNKKPSSNAKGFPVGRRKVSIIELFT
jgi:hypothetical protein